MNDKRWLKLRRPSTQPAANVKIIERLNSLSAVMISSYFPRRTKIKEPDIPGKIIAQMAIIPDIKTNQREEDVSVGLISVIKKIETVPIISAIIDPTDHFLIIFPTKKHEATMRPKKNDHNRIGWCTNACLIN